jgi:hypothetical protein
MIEPEAREDRRQWTVQGQLGRSCAAHGDAVTQPDDATSSRPLGDPGGLLEEQSAQNQYLRPPTARPI